MTQANDNSQLQGNKLITAAMDNDQITFDLLLKLVAFAHNGTLNKTAEQLLITQPTITRGLQQLENLLGVQLFDRKPNKLTFTKTGELAVKQAQALLQAQANFVTTVKNYAATQKIMVGGTLPAPIWLFGQLNSNAKTLPKLLTPAEIEPALNNFSADITFSNQEIFTNTIESRYIGEEQLSIALPPTSALATKTSVTFADLAGLSFLVASDIGIWKHIIEQHIPNHHFMYQQSLATMDTLTQATDFPVFRSNLTSKLEYHAPESERNAVIPITDDAATITFYANYNKENAAAFQPLFEKLTKLLA